MRLHRPLDRIDCELLSALQKDARLSNKELAAHVALAESTCLQRVNRLIATGVLRAFHANVSPVDLGATLEAMVSVRMSRQDHEAVTALRAALGAMPEVVAWYNLAGADDFLVHVVVPSTGHLRDVCLDGIASLSMVRHVETSLIFDSYRAPELPNYLDLPQK